MKTRSINADKVEHSEKHRQATNTDAEVATLIILPKAKGVQSTDELTKLGDEFRQSYGELEKQKLQLQATFKLSIAEATKCGKILLEAKKLAGHGGWMDWLKEHAKISVSTAERYMHLARNSSSVMNLTGKTLTQCYHDMGLLKESKSKNKEGQPSCPEPSEFLQAKGLAVRLWNLLITTSNTDKMAEELVPILQWHQQYLDEKMKKQDAKELDQKFDQVS